MSKVGQNPMKRWPFLPLTCYLKGKKKSSTYKFQDDGHISSTPVVHVKLQEGCNSTSKYAKNHRLGVKLVKIAKPK